MNGLRKAVVLATVEQQLLLAANLIVAIVTSRLMPPAEIGIAVLGTAIVAIITGLREFAPANYLIKHTNLSVEQSHSALSGIIAWNAALTAGLAICAPLLGYIYGDDRVAHFLRIVALALMVEAFHLPILAVLRRDMAFDLSATIVTIGTASMITTTLGLASAGFGYTSFAFGLLAGHTASTITANIIRPQFWLFKPRLSAWNSIFKFGSFNGSNVLLRQLCDALPYMVIGRVLSFEMVAVFHRALMLSQLPQKLLLTGLENLMLSTFTGLASSTEALKSGFLKTVECVTAVYWPAIIVAAILAEPLVKLLYGEAFMPSAPLFQIMVLAASFAFIGRLDNSLLIATGAMHDMLKRGVIVFPLSAMIISAGALFGVMPLVASYWITYPVQLASSLIAIRRNVSFTLAELVSVMRTSAVATAAAAVGPALFYLEFNGSWSLITFFGAIMTGIAGWLIALWLSRHLLIMSVVARDAR